MREPIEGRSQIATIEYTLAFVGFMVAVSAMIVTSIPWALCGLAIMALGIAYFFIKRNEDWD